MNEMLERLSDPETSEDERAKIVETLRMSSGKLLAKKLCGRDCSKCKCAKPKKE